MSGRNLHVTILAIVAGQAIAWMSFAQAQDGAYLTYGEPRRLILPEQRRIESRRPEEMAPAPLPRMPAPPTVSGELPAACDLSIELHEAVRIALENARVVRVLAGTFAQSSGATIYDPAITNTQIDANRGRFDPTLQNNSAWRQTDLPGAQFIPPLPSTDVGIFGNVSNGFNNVTTLQKRFLTGGTLGLSVTPNYQRFNNGVGLPLNSQTTNATILQATQPLLANAGYRANSVPILVARLDTERSFFELKDRVQELARGVAEGYWQLAFTNVEVWVREQQIKQTQFTLDLNEARLKVGISDGGDVYQARVSLESFRAQLILARANRLQREAALRNLLGLPPSDGSRLVGVSLPRKDRVEHDWDGLVSLAERHRPDLIELKLVLEADAEQIYLADNQAKPQLDAVGSYRWNGLAGILPAGGTLNDGGRFSDWTMGVNFSVPLGLRQARANLRQREILLMRDRANLEQALHQTTHILAQNLRNLDQFHEQYAAFAKMRVAAEQNLDYRLAIDSVGGLSGPRATPTPFLNVLQAINDWGNAVLNEAQSITLYNVELANLERQTGTILESHGVRFFEERYGSLGPLGRHHDPVCYPAAISPGRNTPREEAPESARWRRPAEYSLPKEKRRPERPSVDEVDSENAADDDANDKDMSDDEPKLIEGDEDENDIGSPAEPRGEDESGSRRRRYFR